MEIVLNFMPVLNMFSTINLTHFVLPLALVLGLG